MTPKELVMRAIRFESVPRVPVAVLNGYLWMMRRENMSFQNLFDMDIEEGVDFILKGYEILNSDFVYANAQTSAAMRETMGGKSDFSVPGPGAVVKRTDVHTASDIKNYSVQDVFEKTVNNPLFKLLDSQLELMNKKVGDEKYILAFGTGPLTTAAGIIGMEELLMALTEGGDDLRRILDFSVEITIKMLKHQLDHGATAISVADPLSSINLISEEFFEEYSLPGLKEISAAFDDKTVPSMLHICGDTTARLKPVMDAGYDIFSVDAVDLKSTLELIRGHYTLFGNLNTVQVMLGSSSEEVYSIAHERCAIAGLNGGFILAPGCDLPPDTPYENVEAMVNAAYGR